MHWMSSIAPGLSPRFDDRNGRVLFHGSSLEVLRALPDNCVQTVVTSPPYWGLRDYSTATWDGGDPECDHQETRGGVGAASAKQLTSAGASTTYRFRDECGKCGAKRVDQQLGLEVVPDCLGWATKQPCGECYVCHMVEVFREVRRVLRPDGTVWLNLGDSYASTPPGNSTVGVSAKSTLNGVNGESGQYRNTLASGTQTKRNTIVSGLKPKDLAGIPWRVALAMQADGWWLRQDIIWAKPSPMPESVTDRCTKAHEYIFLLTKSERYFFDNVAIREDFADDRMGRDGSRLESERNRGGRTDGWTKPNNIDPSANGGRNKRSVWTISTKPYSGAHFAVFPPEIPELAILAGTSEAGACPICMTPFERVIEKDRQPTRHGTGSKYNDGEAGDPGHGNPERHCTTIVSKGWQQACKCELPENVRTEKCVVLDPFCGSGTTIDVAREMGCAAIGIELSDDYCRLICDRLRQTVFL